MDSPAWLQETSSAPAPAPDRHIVAAPAPVAPVNIGEDEQAEPDLPGVILTMRLANMGVAASMMAISVCFSVYFNTLAV